MQVKKTNYRVHATPTFEVLTQEEIEAIYYSALTVLYETGVRVYEKEGVEVAYAGGAIVEDATEDSSLVKMPPWMVDRALATLPRKVVVTGPTASTAWSFTRIRFTLGRVPTRPLPWTLHRPAAARHL